MREWAYTSAMADTSHYSQIAIRCGGLTVELGTETEYPDMIDDLTNRALNVFKEAITAAKENGVDVSNMRLITVEHGDDFDEED